MSAQMKSSVLVATSMLLFLVAGLAQAATREGEPDCAETLILKKLDDLQKKKANWLSPETVTTLGLGLGGWIVAALTIAANRKAEQRKQQLEQLFQALHWFEGGTQERSIGIAIIEANQEKFRGEMSGIWASVLVSQAKHILSKSDPKSETEDTNLRRIMRLLQSHELTRDQRHDLCSALGLAFIELSAGRPGLVISGRQRDEWLSKFACKG
jgi:hypothetical protein